MRRRLLTALIIGAGTIVPFQARAQPAPQSPVPVPAAPSNLLPGQKAPKVTDVWVVFKTHCDLGYTLSTDAVNEKYRVAMMDNAIRLMEADRTKPADERLKWTIAGWPMAENILGPKQDPARKANVEEGLRDGAFAVHALPASLHTDSFDPEDLVRGLGFSSRVARAYGKPLPISGKMTDVPGHGWIWPTLLQHAGIKFLQIGSNYSVHPMVLPRLFWWEGPDGSRILCNYTPNYGSDPTPPQDWPSKHYLAVIMTHDNEGPPSPKDVTIIRARVAQLPGVRLHFGTMDDFANAVLADKPELPVVRGDMVDSWIQGLGSMPVETKTIRDTRPLLPALDLLDTQLRLWNLTPPPLATDLAKAYEQSMLYGEHTWGANTPGWGFWSDNGSNRGTERYLYGDAFLKAREGGYYKKFEAAFDDHRAYSRDAADISGKNLGERLSLLARSIQQDGGRIVVFNPLPWSRSGIVEVDGHSYLAKDVPSCGYLTLKDEPDATEQSKPADRVETRHFKATFDLKRGGISSLVATATGRELLDTTSPYALGQFLSERFSEAQTWDYYNRYNTMNNAAWGTVKPNMPKDAVYQASTPADWRMSVTHSPLRDVVTLTAGPTAGLADEIFITFTFPATEPFVETEWRVNGKTPTTIPEGGWLCFPFAISQPKFLLGRQGGVMDLSKDQLPGGNRHLYGVQTGVALTAPDGSGSALCAMDSPCLSFGEPGLWKFSYDYFPRNASVFVNLYNNMWNTNFPLWIEGSWSNRVRVWPLAKGTNTTGNLITQSWEARCPLQAVRATGPGGQLPATQTGLTLSRKGVLVTAFGGNPDGEYTLLRVWEQAGESGELAVKLPAGSNFTVARPVNLRGEAEGAVVPIKNQILRFPLKGNAPASFILK